MSTNEQTFKVMLTRRHALRLAAVAGGAALMGIAPRAQAQTAEADLAALVAAAQKEGKFTLYSAATENVVKRTGDAFKAKYGIDVEFLRLSSSKLQQRFATEAEAGSIVADMLLFAGNSESFAAEGIPKGWFQSLSDANLPVAASGEFPAQWDRGATAIVQVGPWLIVYNTDNVAAADAPKEWIDILDPKWKGELLCVDPRSSDAYLDLWTLLLERHGPSFFERFVAQEPRFAPGGSAVLQSLAAGEGSLAFPQIADSARILENAPVEITVPSLTTGVEIQVILCAPDKGNSPNAARLFANYIMSKEGNLVMNSDPDSASIYDTSGLPHDYHSPVSAKSAASKDEIMALLGLTAG